MPPPFLGEPGVFPGAAAMTGLTQPSAALPRSSSVQGPQNVPASMGAGNPSDSAMGVVPSSEGPFSTQVRYYTRFSSTFRRPECVKTCGPVVVFAFTSSWPRRGIRCRSRRSFSMRLMVYLRCSVSSFTCSLACSTSSALTEFLLWG